MSPRETKVLYDVEYNIKRAREIYDENRMERTWGAYTSKSIVAFR